VAQKRQRSKQRQAERRAQRLAGRGDDASTRPSNDDDRELEEVVDLDVGAPPQDLGSPEFTTRHEEPLPPDFEVDDDELLEDETGGPAPPRGPRGVRGDGEPGRPDRHERGRLLEFLKAVWAELQRVQWPDRRQLTQLTGVVLFFVLIVGVYLGALDAIFSKLINSIL
jgi:preprotein translocase SecE subunit